ncbi:MAG: hypothetical protein Kow0059_11620 [Candidatus Sumerlaeia bacterium]
MTAILILTPVRRWGLVLAGYIPAGIAANLLFGRSMGVSAGLALAHVLESLCAALVFFRMTQGRRTLERLRDCVALTGAAAVLSSAISATIAASVLNLWGGSAAGWNVWALWWMSDYMGLITTSPLLLALASQKKACQMLPPHPIREGTVLGAILVLITWLVFRRPLGLADIHLSHLYLVFPALIWAAARFGPGGAALASAVTAGVAVWFTANGYGPMSRLPVTMQERVFWLQAFLAASVLSALFLAAVAAERRCAEMALRRRELLSQAVARAAEGLLRTPARRYAAVELLEHLCEPLGAERAFAWENQSAGADGWRVFHIGQWPRTPEGTSAPGFIAPPVALESPAWAGIRGALERGEALLLNSLPVPADQSTGSAMSAPGAGDSAALVPVFAGAAWWGVLGFERMRAALPWSNAELNVLTTAAGALGAAIERQRTETALRDSEIRFRLLAENIPGVIYLCLNDDAYTMLYLNDQIESLCGYSKDDFLQNRVLFADLIHPEDRQNVVDEVNRSLPERRPYHLIYRLRRRNGDYCWVEEFGCGVFQDPDLSPELLEGFIHDITERIRAEAALRESEARYRLLAENATDMISRHEAGPEARYLYVSPACRLLLGYEPDEMIGRPAFDFIADDHLEPTRQARADLLKQDESLMQQYQMLRKDGTCVWVESRARALRNPQTGRVEEIIAITRDITARRQLEDEQRRIQERMQQFQKLESLGVLAGGIAHDFNNLLVGILGAAGLALMDLTPDSPTRAHIEQIEASAQRAAELTRQMLAYSGKGRFVVEPVNLTRLVEEMLQLLKVSIGKNIQLRLDLAPDLPLIEADATQIRQVIMNLIINAAEAIGHNDGSIAVTTGVLFADSAYLAATFLYEQQREGRYVFVEVADTGCGMDAATQSRIFDPFFSTKATGRGLGLGAVLGIVRSHGGFVCVTSHVGKGTTIRTGFPVQETPARLPTPEPVQQQPGRLDGTILVVDDDETARGLVRRVLEKAGASVLTAADGMSALTAFQDNATAVRAVLLDLILPDIPGEEVFHRLRRIGPHVPIIAMSGYNEHLVLHRLAGQQAAGFIQKPFLPSELISKVSAVLKS